MDQELEGDIEPVTLVVEEVKIDTIKDAIKNVIKKSLAADGKYQVELLLNYPRKLCVYHGEKQRGRSEWSVCSFYWKDTSAIV